MITVRVLQRTSKAGSAVLGRLRDLVPMGLAFGAAAAIPFVSHLLRLRDNDVDATIFIFFEAVAFFAVLHAIATNLEVGAHQIAAAALTLVIIEIVAIFVFALGYAFLGVIVHPQGSAPGVPISDAGTLIYFSFSAFTTVGYGDVIPIGGRTHAMAAAEAFLGNAYNATFFGTIVLKIVSTVEHRQANTKTDPDSLKIGV
jgi:voltage-gated potassium channel Kch